eukprot:1186408-Prorocentrum_minimum.AAC.4
MITKVHHHRNFMKSVTVYSYLPRHLDKSASKLTRIITAAWTTQASGLILVSNQHYDRHTPRKPLGLSARGVTMATQHGIRTRFVHAPCQPCTTVLLVIIADDEPDRREA